MHRQNSVNFSKVFKCCYKTNKDAILENKYDFKIKNNVILKKIKIYFLRSV